MPIICIICILYFFPQQISALMLRDQLLQAKTGDYVVTLQGKSATLLHIYQKTDADLILEEVSIPTNRTPVNMCWKDWLAQGAPQNTSWLLYTVKLATGQIERCFSMTRNQWIDFSQGETFLPTLMNLKFIAVPENDRRKVGSPPDTGSPDRRKNWNPPLFVDGKLIPGALFDVWRARWPRDGGELSDRVIEIYLPQNKENRYPSYFPYWLQIKGGIARANVRIIDSGSGMISPAPAMPNPNN